MDQDLLPKDKLVATTFRAEHIHVGQSSNMTQMTPLSYNSFSFSVGITCNLLLTNKIWKKQWDVIYVTALYGKEKDFINVIKTPNKLKL